MRLRHAITKYNIAVEVEKAAHRQYKNLHTKQNMLNRASKKRNRRRSIGNTISFNSKNKSLEESLLHQLAFEKVDLEISKLQKEIADAERDAAQYEMDCENLSAMIKKKENN